MDLFLEGKVFHPPEPIPVDGVGLTSSLQEVGRCCVPLPLLVFGYYDLAGYIGICLVGSYALKRRYRYTDFISYRLSRNFTRVHKHHLLYKFAFRPSVVKNEVKIEFDRFFCVTTP